MTSEAGVKVRLSAVLDRMVPVGRESELPSGAPLGEEGFGLDLAQPSLDDWATALAKA